MDLLIAGKILGTHHLKGEVKVKSVIKNLDNLVGEKIVLELENETQKILTVKEVNHFHTDNWSIKFEEINNKQDAMLLRNSKIEVRRDILGIADDEVLVSELIGMKVIDRKTNEELGSLVEVLETAAHDIFIVDSEEYECMIPDVDDFVKNIDFKEKKIYVELIEGLREKKQKK